MTSASDPYTAPQRWGYIDPNGQLVIPYQFDLAQPHSEGLAPVKAGGRYGYIDRTGQWVIPPTLESLGPFEGGLATASRDGKDGLIDKTGSFVVPPVFEYVSSSFQNGLAQANTNGLTGYIDRSGKFVIPPQFEFAEEFCDGFARVKDPNKYEHSWFIDPQGKMTYGPFDAAEDFSEGWASVWKNGKCYFINTKGQTVLELPPGVAVGRFKEGLAAADQHPLYPEEASLYGHIDRKGRWVIAAQFDLTGHFLNGMAHVRVGEKHGMINKQGKYVCPPKYDYLDDMFENRIKFKLGKFQGYCNEHGEVVIEPIYLLGQRFSEGLAAVCLPGGRDQPLKVFRGEKKKTNQ